MSFAPSYPTNENINFSDFSNMQQQSSQYTESIQAQTLTQNNIQNQNQPNENIMVNATQNQNQNQLNENIMLNAISNDYNTYNNYKYENFQTYKTKTKRKKIEKITLSLRRFQESPDNQNLVESFSPQKEEETKKVEQNIVETNTMQTYEQLYPANPQPLIPNFELENLRNENNRLNEVINQLRTQIQILVQENQNLKLKSSIPNVPNGNDSQEILFLKEENNRLIKEIELLRSKLIEFEEYKRLKEEQISYLKIQLEELYQNAKKFEAYALSKDKEIQQLKMYIQELLRKLQLNESNKTQVNLEDQMLSIQDTRLEIIKGDIIQDARELELISRKICKNSNTVSLDLLYKASIDSDKAAVFHKKCDKAKSSLVLVKSKNGKRFGGYTTQDWKGDSIEKKDENAFVFSLDKMKIYEIIPGEDAIGCYPKFGPVFLGCQIRLYDEFFTQGGSTFEKGLNYSTEEDFELTGGLKKFEVKDVEVYSVELE